MFGTAEKNTVLICIHSPSGAVSPRNQDWRAEETEAERLSWSHGTEKTQTLIMKVSSYTTILHSPPCPDRVSSLECAVLADAIGAVIDYERGACQKCLREIFFLRLRRT